MNSLRLWYHPCPYSMLLKAYKPAVQTSLNSGNIQGLYQVDFQIILRRRILIRENGQRARTDHEERSTKRTMGKQGLNVSEPQTTKCASQIVPDCRSLIRSGSLLADANHISSYKPIPVLFKIQKIEARSSYTEHRRRLWLRVEAYTGTPILLRISSIGFPLPSPLLRANHICAPLNERIIFACGSNNHNDPGSYRNAQKDGE